jgi:hypothetical protein
VEAPRLAIAQGVEALQVAYFAVRFGKWQPGRIFRHRPFAYEDFEVGKGGQAFAQDQEAQKSDFRADLKVPLTQLIRDIRPYPILSFMIY